MQEPQESTELVLFFSSWRLYVGSACFRVVACCFSAVYWLRRCFTETGLDPVLGEKERSWALNQKHDLILAGTERRSGDVYLFSDEGGVQGAGVLRTTCSRLEKLLYQSRLLLLQLGDALTLLRHLLKPAETEANKKQKWDIFANLTRALIKWFSWQRVEPVWEVDSGPSVSGWPVEEPDQEAEGSQRGPPSERHQEKKTAGKERDQTWVSTFTCRCMPAGISNNSNTTLTL